MSDSAAPEDESFREKVGATYDERVPDFTKTLNILVVGKVSTGKSSLINALLRRGRENTVADVGPESGKTTKVHPYRLDDRVCIVDSPGLDDVEQEKSELTEKFLKSVDAGIVVLTGSADATQKGHLEKLRAHCKRVFVVLNKVDEWDRLVVSALDDVIAQWKSALGVEKMYRTCTFGFDPSTRPGVPPDLRGVDELRADLETFLEAEGKALLFARQMGEKRSYAMKMIVGAMIAVGGEAFIPGSAAYITATQAIAITSLYYLYTGRVLSKASALAIIPLFAAEAAGSSLFLLVKSLLPPTGVLDVAAAGVAMSVTAAMLLTVNSLLAAGAELHEQDKLRDRFRRLRSQVKEAVGDASREELLSKGFWQRIIRDLMYK
jgi:small GTP-binding protein